MAQIDEFDSEVIMSSQQSRTVSALRLAAPILALLSVTMGGCRQSGGEAPKVTTEQSTRSVTVVNPERKTIRREVGQPGSIQAFERTPIVSKIPGYVLKWNVDLGDVVKGPKYDANGKLISPAEVLAELWVPELVSELKLKQEQVKQAQKGVEMAKAQVLSAKAQVQEVEAGLGRVEATHKYWKGQSDRFTGLVQDGTLDKQTQEDTLNMLRSAAAAVTETKAKVQSAMALRHEKEQAQEKAEADLGAAGADLRRQSDLVGYATLTAPYDGVITQKNIDTKKFVQPATGPQAEVLYVVERIDTVRVFVSVPETDADWVHVDAPATIRIQAIQGQDSRGQEFKGKVTRTAWSLNQVTRTLLAEIDLPNPEIPKLGRRLRPGMYAYATIEAEWPDVLTIPASAVLTEGDVNVGYQSFCFIVENGRVKRTQIEIGARNDQLVEVLKKRIPQAMPGAAQYTPFTGTEQLVRSDVSSLKDGQEVSLLQKP